MSFNRISQRDSQSLRNITDLWKYKTSKHIKLLEMTVYFHLSIMLCKTDPLLRVLSLIGGFFFIDLNSKRYSYFFSAPAHEHHIIALHKHGHHFGGLPTIFWVSIAFLIFIFHMFLCKLIYNEYCQGQDRYGRTRYSI